MISFSPANFSHKTYSVLADLVEDKSLITALVRVEQARTALLRTYAVYEDSPRYCGDDADSLILAINEFSRKQLVDDLGLPEAAAEELLEFIDNPNGTIFDNVIAEMKYGAMKMLEVAQEWEGMLSRLRLTMKED